MLIHEIFGLTDWAQEMADEFAAEGYIVIVPDLLWGSLTNGGMEELIKSGGNVGKAIQALPPDQITEDLKAAVDYAAKLDAGNGKVVVAGFCWGGGQSFRFATNNKNLKAAFVFYGTPPKKPMTWRASIVRSMAFYAGNDARVSARRSLQKATEEMKAAGKTYQPVIYDGAGHGFMLRGRSAGRERREQKKRAMPRSSARLNCRRKFRSFGIEIKPSDADSNGSEMFGRNNNRRY